MTEAKISISMPLTPPGDRLCESIKLEDHLMRVPLEILKKSAKKTNQILEKEMNAILNSVTEAAEKDHLRKEKAAEHLTSLDSKLRGLKRKLTESNTNDQTQIRRCRARLHHLSDPHEFYAKRQDRILVDYMLRSCYHKTAKKLAETHGIEDLVDIDIFTELKKMFDALKNGEFGPALEWCSQNKSKLKEVKSKLEFRLRKQEYVELIRVNRHMDAITYARKHLSQWGEIYRQDFIHAMGALLYKSDTDCERYKDLFHDNNLDDLVKFFILNFCRVCGLSSQPFLNIYLQAGLSSLKSIACYEGKCPSGDPLAQESFRGLAASLPFRKDSSSKILCYITKTIMDVNNPPLAFPNGYVYGTKAMEEMAMKNDGKVTCPRSGLVCDFANLEKVFII